MGSKDWIQTLSGKKMIPAALTPDMVGSIEEIAHSLAGEFRFTRQTLQRYTVAQHCVEGSRLLPPVFAGAFLLHELSEVYLPDIAGPLKPLLRVTHEFDKGQTTWRELERQHTRVILESLGLASIEPLIYCSEVKQMDLAMLAAEKRDLCSPEPESWGLTVFPPPSFHIAAVWSVDRACVEFLTRFHSLFTTT